MTRVRKSSAFLCVVALGSANLEASELSYTFIDFSSLNQSVGIYGNQQPDPNQNVFVQSDNADGIALSGSLGITERFFLSGEFTTSIVDVTGTITSPLTQVTVEDTYDLLTSRVGFGYVLPIGENFDFLFDVSYDSREVDFGSLAGENFDSKDSGIGYGVGMRWNPTRAVELHAITRIQPVGETLLDTLEFDSEVVAQAGIFWYVLEDLGLGASFESGQVDTVSLSVRFSFGTLQW